MMTTLIAIVTFLWYRNGRLWNFYYTLLCKCVEQIKENSIDRENWEKIALHQCNAIFSQQIFQSLCRIEVEYLRYAILNHQYEFWISDSETTADGHITYTNKEQFCRYRLEELFLPDFQWCGVQLFFRALCWNFTKEKVIDKGYVKTQLSQEQKSGRGES